ncbi:MAG TPA: MarR family transcriptional regulator [Streptosporangiaceae bacterium]|nr:MarR family transcriptional regulator [Streptosporangiaceae bacterium]
MSESGERWEVPWPQGLESSTWSPERASLAKTFAGAIRQTVSLMVLMTQAAADRIGINATDLNCLNILSFSGQLTAGELAKATGLTTASITGVVDRLEQAGFVRRERDAQDRRRVVVHLDTVRALGTVAPVFGPMLGAMQQLADEYTDDELQLIVQFYAQLQDILRNHLARLRES